MKYNITYKWTKEFFQERIANASFVTSGEMATGTWLYEFPEERLQEAERLNVLLPLIKWCAENGMLTEMLEDELYLYYEDYVGGKLDGVLADYEAEMVVKDLIDAYQRVFQTYAEN